MITHLENLKRFSDNFEQYENKVLATINIMPNISPVDRDNVVKYITNIDMRETVKIDNIVTICINFMINNFNKTINESLIENLKNELYEKIKEFDVDCNHASYNLSLDGLINDIKILSGESTHFTNKEIHLYVEKWSDKIRTHIKKIKCS